MDIQKSLGQSIGAATDLIKMKAPVKGNKNAYHAVTLAGVAGQLKPPLAVQLLKIIKELA